MSTMTTGGDALLLPGFTPKGAYCRITLNSGANPTIVTNMGFASIVRSGTGVYVFTLAERVNELALPIPTFQKSDATYHEFAISAVTTTGFTLTHLQGAYGAAPAAADNTGITALTVFIVGEQN